jgi:hypothetical protein
MKNIAIEETVVAGERYLNLDLDDDSTLEDPPNRPLF